MGGGTRLTCAVLVCVLYVVGANGLTKTPEPAPSKAPKKELGRRWKKEYLGDTPKHFKSIAKFDFRHEKGLKETQNISPQCGSVKNPKIQTSVPRWASNKPAADLAKAPHVTQVKNEQGKLVAAFEKDGAVVIKECGTRVLKAVVWWVRALQGKNVTPPNYSIYFDCDGGQHTITVPETLSFGKSSVAGKWRLIAPYQNITLDGKKKVRIMSLNGRGAQLTVYGITFYRGWSVCPVTSISSGDASVCSERNYGGGAILVNQEASLVAQNCAFKTNRSGGLFARWSGGGAIKAETKAYVLVWGCTFESNQALGGGAIAVSSSYVLYVESSVFFWNSAIGGMDGSAANKGLKKNKLLLLGGAIRVDSIHGYERRRMHVVLCDSAFVENSIEFSAARLTDTFDYSPEHALTYLKAKGAAAMLWNTSGNLDLQAGDFQFSTVQNCTFESNFEEIEQKDAGHMGAYVMTISGAGNTDLADIKFTDNLVQKASMLLQISSIPDHGFIFQVKCQQISFAEKNTTLEYIIADALQSEQAHCTFSDVDGVPNGSGPCVAYLDSS